MGSYIEEDLGATNKMLVWEDCSCDWCGSSASERLFSGGDLLHDLPGEFHMVRCSQCGLIRQNPRLAWESLKSYYPEDYSAYQSIIEKEPSRLRRLDRRYGMWKRLRAIQRFQPEGRLLDVGSGTGIFLAEAQRAGRWELMAVEPSPGAASYVRSELEIPVLNHRFAEADLPEDHFDVITMWNVLEHLDHPVRDLDRAARLLREGGLLVLSIPKVESLDARLFGPCWAGWDLPRHLYLFPQVQLKDLLSEAGLQVVDSRCLAGSHSAFELSLEFWLKARGTAKRAARSLLAVYRSLPVRLAASLPFWLVDQANRCTVITVFAQKKGGR
jgi:SAM-dependent methyltransferase